MTQNFVKFNDSFTTFLYEQIPIQYLKITRNDNVLVKELKDQKDFKFPSNFKIAKYIDSIRVGIYQLLISDRFTFSENLIKSYTITSNHYGRIFVVNDIKGLQSQQEQNKQQKPKQYKEWIVQL